MIIMEIGIVVHGPDVVDSGMAAKVIDRMRELGNVSVVMAGTIGKTAVLDAHLENLIDISKSLKPSKCIEEFFLTKDLIILLNHGKTTENGLLFANIVVSRIEDRNIKPLVQIERPGLSDGKVIPWNFKSTNEAEKISEMLDLELEDVPELVKPISIEDHGHRIIRNVYGVHVGEKIMINGIIVGFAESEDIRIISENGFIREIEGARIKEHGLEKLHGYKNRIPIDLRTCWIKSGPLRSGKFSVRRKEKAPETYGKTKKNIPDANNNANTAPGKIKAVIIDHEAESTFELIGDADIAVTIGDDTTDLAADILYRLRIPVIGITDGDLDGFSHMKHIYPGSVVIRLESGNDDIVGKKIREDIFDGKTAAEFDSINALRNNIFRLSKKLIIFRKDY
ncbi:DUF2117 domain-containing protein [Methanolobus sediminis]|uniref:DUF2117 domain-containing protein n=1 Tax=Methanolobus sediminis TaxID=3072978 RepID=A0AA51YJ87_9EURY|nr:DUF2117 domain-containing protein [Methanolobus sediminis]WMW25331.1 DUF2117 domain-containing protein [Methanolobus sediminis]